MVPLEPRLQAESGGGAGRTFVSASCTRRARLGKGLVAAMLQASGFRVVDLGINVSGSASWMRCASTSRPSSAWALT